MVERGVKRGVCETLTNEEALFDRSGHYTPSPFRLIKREIHLHPFQYQIQSPNPNPNRLLEHDSGERDT